MNYLRLPGTVIIFVLVLVGKSPLSFTKKKNIVHPYKYFFRGK